MKPAEFRRRSNGGLNLEANLNEVPQTDFIDGFDLVDSNPKANNEKGLLQPCSNTQLAYDLGIVDQAVTKEYLSLIHI